MRPRVSVVRSRIRARWLAAGAACLSIGVAYGAGDSATPRVADIHGPIEEVQVSGERPGPGLWKIRRGENTVYVLGTTSPLPRKMKFRSRELEKVLSEAGLFIPTRPSVDVKAGPIRLIRLYRDWRKLRLNPGGVGLDAVLPPELYARFHEARLRYAPRNRKLEVHFRTILERKSRAAHALCNALQAAGQLQASQREIDALAVNMVVVATWWLSYEYVSHARRFSDEQYQSQAMARGAYQVLSLIAPHLDPSGRELFNRLADEYIQK